MPIIGQTDRRPTTPLQLLRDTPTGLMDICHIIPELPVCDSPPPLVQNLSILTAQTKTLYILFLAPNHHIFLGHLTPATHSGSATYHERSCRPRWVCDHCSSPSKTAQTATTQWV